MSPVGDTLRQQLSELPGLELAFLFGSHASGSARPDSDIDLAVLLERPISADLKQALTPTRHVMNVADFLPLRQRILDERRSAWIR
jgi:uncharacterized protein